MAKKDGDEYVYFYRNGKLLRFIPKDKKTTLFRGLTQKYDPNFDNTKLDNPNGYESWTDNYDLAKQYAGEDGYVYSTEIDNNEINTTDILDENGDRSLVYWNDKPVGLNGQSGEEYMVYTDHDDHNKLDYKEISSPKKKENKPSKEEEFKERISLIKQANELSEITKRSISQENIKKASNEELRNLVDNLERIKQMNDETQYGYLLRKQRERTEERLKGVSNANQNNPERLALENQIKQAEMNRSYENNEQVRINRMLNDYKTYDLLTLRRIIKEFEPDRNLSGYADNLKSKDAYSDKLKLQKILAEILNKKKK